MKARILTVDDEQMIRELLFASLSREGHICFQAGNFEDALEIFRQERIDIALLDIMMPGRSGVELLEEIKKSSPDTAVIMVTALSDMETALKCIQTGADDYILKPFDVDRILLTVRNTIDKQRLTLENREYQMNLEKKVLEQTSQIMAAMNELNLAYDQTLSALVRALDAREKEIGSHSERVMAYTKLLAETLGIKEPQLSIMLKGALLHDIGKIGVSDNILLKPGKLDDDEWVEMRRHPQMGHQILSGIKFLKGAGEFVLAHHERFDGNGYPNRLKGHDIPLGARIFALVDTLDAMTSDRPYRKALTMDETVEEIIRCTGTQFDPKITEAFLSIPRHVWEETAANSSFNLDATRHMASIFMR